MIDKLLYYIKDDKGQYLREFNVNAGRVNKTFVNLRSEARAFIELSVAENYNDYPELNETIIQVELDIDTINLEDSTGQSEWVILDDKNFYLQVFAESEGKSSKTFTEDYTIRRRFLTLESAQTLSANPKLDGIVARVTETEVPQI